MSCSCYEWNQLGILRKIFIMHPRLIEQQSFARCIPNVSFGSSDRDTMWVRNGCRGRFLCRGRPVQCGRAFGVSRKKNTNCVCTDGHGPSGRAGCRIYVAQPPPNLTVATDTLHRHEQYSVHYWLQRSLLAHPYRKGVNERSSADVIFFNYSFSFPHATRYPMLNHLRREGYHLEADECDNSSNGEATVPGPVVLFATSHPLKFRMRTGPRQAERWITMELNSLTQSDYHDLVAPYVVSQPDWLVDGRPTIGVREPQDNAPRSERVEWEQRHWSTRPLLFFAGRVRLCHASDARTIARPRTRV